MDKLYEAARGVMAREHRTLFPLIKDEINKELPPGWSLVEDVKISDATTIALTTGEFVVKRRIPGERLVRPQDALYTFLSYTASMIKEIEAITNGERIKKNC